jgi:hypothetical protein
MRNLLPLLALALLACRSQSPQSPVHFAREEIEMRVFENRVEIMGNYHFQSATDKPLSAMMFYPFPLDAGHGFPDSVAVPGLAFSRQDSGVSFGFAFRPRAEDSFQVFYRQPLSVKSARYIVTTTRQWNRPIDQARFRITVPASLTGVKLSYPHDRLERTDSTVTYSFARRRFFPSEDIVVSWR